jgi:hypothetical protein
VIIAGGDLRWLAKKIVDDQQIAQDVAAVCRLRLVAHLHRFSIRIGEGGIGQVPHFVLTPADYYE